MLQEVGISGFFVTSRGFGLIEQAAHGAANQVDHGDEGLAAKRKALVIASLLLLALSVSGAAIKEANTFIFRVEFSNHAGLTHLLGVAVVFLMLRYYAYAQSYHSQLFDLWAARLLSDYRVFSYDTSEDEVNGLLGKEVNVWGGDEPGIQDARYKKLVYSKETSFTPHVVMMNVMVNIVMRKILN